MISNFLISGLYYPHILSTLNPFKAMKNRDVSHVYQLFTPLYFSGIKAPPFKVD